MLTADKTITINGVLVRQYFLYKHNVNNIALPPKRTKKLIGVTIHNTIDLPGVADDPEQYTRATVNGNMGSVRVHYYVDELGAWQNLDTAYCNWTCADGTGSGNMQTIAIECIMDGTSGTNNLKARDNTARLAAWLLYTNGLTADDLYTHTYWLHIRDGHKGTKRELMTRPHPYKTCPYYIIPDWDGFCSLVKTYFNALKGGFKSYKIRIKEDLNVRKDAGTNNPVVMVLHPKEIYTITAEKQVGTVKWGKLKSGVGWVSLLDKYSDKI